ncbi:hypothetical protein EON65_33410 [archaeon]|nr:MAG: hypothetical protein EON65_33410 [archaeon]
MLRADKSSPPKSAPPATEPKKKGAQKAKEVLKKAIIEGKLGEILWQDDKGTASKPTTSQGIDRTTRVKAPEEMDMREFYALNDVLIWNEILEARVLRTSKLSDLFEKFFPSNPALDLGTVSVDPEHDDGDEEDGAGEEGSEGEEQADHHPAETPHNSASPIRRSTNSKRKNEQLIGIVNLVKKGRRLSKTPSKTPVPPKELTLEEQLKAFETMPVSVEKGRKMSVIGRTTLRVKDFIANTRRATLSHVEVGNEGEKGDGAKKNPDSPEVNSPDESENEDKFSTDVKQASITFIFIYVYLDILPNAHY